MLLKKTKSAVGQIAAAVSQAGSMSPTSDLRRAVAASGVKERFFGSLGGAGRAALGDIA